MNLASHPASNLLHHGHLGGGASAMASLLTESLFASAAANTQSSYFVILDPLNTGNNTTKNSYLTRNII
jgi:hypothetical protein